MKVVRQVLWSSRLQSDRWPGANIRYRRDLYHCALGWASFEPQRVAESRYQKVRMHVKSVTITYNHALYLGINDGSFVRHEALAAPQLRQPSRSVRPLSVRWHRPAGFSPVIQTGIPPLQRELPRKEQAPSPLSAFDLRSQSDRNP